MAIPNLIGLLLLTKELRFLVNDFDSKLKSCLLYTSRLNFVQIRKFAMAFKYTFGQLTIFGERAGKDLSLIHILNA